LRSTRGITLKNGFYIEIQPKFGGQTILVRRDTEEMAMKLMKQYAKSKNVRFLGEFIDGKPLKKIKRKRS